MVARVIVLFVVDCRWVAALTLRAFVGDTVVFVRVPLKAVGTPFA